MGRVLFRLALLLVPVTLALALSGAAGAQSPPPPPDDLRFEVASIRLNTEGGPVQNAFQAGGLFRATNMPIAQIMASSYGITIARIVGAPDWIRTDRYDVIARGAREQPTAEERRALIQRLLRDRFSLIARLETRPTDVYVLERLRPDGELGPRMKASPLNCADPAVRAKTLSLPTRADGLPYCGFGRESGRLRAGSMTLSTLTLILPVGDRPLIDRTGLTGGFDMDLEWTEAPGTGETISIFAALEEQLGLRMSPRTEPLEVLAVERIQRPTEN